MITRQLSTHFRIGLGLILILTQWMTALPAQAASAIRVTPAGSERTGCGSTWDTSCSLSYALSQAGSDSEIWVKAGTYTTQAQNTPFVIPSGAAVYGGFAGSENSRADRNWFRNPTILSGDIQQDDQPNSNNRADNSYHVVLLSNSKSDTRLDGFIIEGGNANGWNSNHNGGGVLVQHGSPTLENLVFRSNVAENGGGAACTGRGTPWWINVRFEKNSAGSGGGFYSDKHCIPIIQGAAFSANRADYGGAIDHQGLIQVGNASISGNTANLRGGGIDSDGYILILLNSIVWGNHQGQAANQIASTYTPFLYNSIIEGGRNLGYSIQDVNPAFVENPSSGPDGQWGTYDDTPGFLDLRYDSPAIDKGQPNVYISLRMTRDLKNWPRAIDHPRPDTAVGSFFDLGGYEAGVIHVRKGATGMADGSSWTDAFPELRDALKAVRPSNEVWVAAAPADQTYQPGTARTNSFALQNEGGIYGGFAGVETLRSQRNWQANPTILSGDLGATGSPSDNAYHVVSAQGTDATAVLDGFTIQDGNANAGSPPFNHGGGIYLENASPRLANLVITNNRAIVGGGLYALSSSYQMADSTLTQNQARFGGGIYQTGAGQPILVNIQFTGNTAADYAGALFNDGGSAPELSNILMAGNQSPNAGSIYNNNNSQPTFRNLTLVGSMGGAMITSGPATTVNLVNSIAWNNGAQAFVTLQGKVNIRRSLVEFGCPTSASCDYIMATDPRLARLPSPGEDGAWGTTDDDYGDLRLAPGSQAIDAGDNSAVLPEVKLDLAGNPRFVDDPYVQDTGIGAPPLVDMGAIEANRGQTVISIDQVKTSPSVVGQEVTIYFHMAGGETTPTGIVTVQSTKGQNPAETCSAPASQGFCTITFLHSGDFSLKAVYAGDGTNHAAESESVVHRVDPADTLVNLQLSPNPATPGQVVHATFSVSPLAPGAGQPTGSVQVGTPPLSCTATLQQCGCDLPLADTGIYSLTAQYSGDTDFNASPSVPVTLQISPVSTDVMILSTAPSPSVINQEVTVHFQVTTSAGTPWGTVTVSDGQAQCSAAAADGQCALVFESAGEHSLVATYEDDYSPANSGSPVFRHLVNGAKTVTTLSLSKLNDIRVGEPVHAGFTVQSLTPGLGVPTGVVKIGDATVSCLTEVGTSGCDLVFNQPGVYTLSAQYQGQGPFASSTSATVTIAVGYSSFLPAIDR